MAEKQVKIDGIDYYTLLNQPADAEANGKIVVLSHALMSNLHMYDHTVPTLNKAGYTTLRFDLVGHGKTPPPDAADFSIHLDDIARHIHQLVEQVTGRKHAHAFIGCSVSGVLALRYALLFPDDVDKAIAIAAPGMVSQEAAKPLWAQRVEQLQEDERTGAHNLARATVNRWFPGERAEDDAVRAESLRHVRTCSLPGYRIMADAIRNYDYEDEVRRIRGVDCLIVAGSEDSSVSPGLLKDTAAKIPGARFVKMDGAGHLPPMQKPDEFEALALPFLAQQK